MTMFQTMGLLVAGYTAYAVVAGRVYVKSGVWGKTLSRAESPVDFWMAIAIYSGLALAMATIF